MSVTEQQILDAVRAIPHGQVATYGELSPGAPRLAGHVLRVASDPTVPWWRVVRADGTLTQGHEQRELLVAEGVPFRPGLTVRVDFAALEPEPGQ